MNTHIIAIVILFLVMNCLMFFNSLSLGNKIEALEMKDDIKDMRIKRLEKELKRWRNE